MTREDAKKIVDIMVEKKDYELVMRIDDYTMIFSYAWSTKNDEINEWEHDFQDTYCNYYTGEEIIEKLIECDKYIFLDEGKTIFAWQSKLENITN